MFFSFLVLFSLMMLSGCGIPQRQSIDEDLQNTEMALSVQQTSISQKATQDYIITLNQQATQTAMEAQNLAAQQTALAEEQSGQPQLQPQETQPPEVITTQEPLPAVDFDTEKQGARVLLFEDIVNLISPPFPTPKPAITTRRYVKDALDNLGLDYKDDGSAKGWLKADLLAGGWDLIIISMEVRGRVSGEYFQYIGQAIDDGSALILEIWYLDAISQGTVSNLLSKCGVEYENNYGTQTMGSNVSYINWPLPGMGDHPIFHDPNSGFKWTNITQFWTGDLGDFIKVSGKKPETELLMGTIATEKNTHGTLAVSGDGRCIIQTFSTHNLAMEEAVPLWENYITYALKSKILGIP